jgi:hypothetical protein
MNLHCLVCTSEIPERRAARNAQTCKPSCQRELKRMKRESEMENLRGNTCPVCFRYVPAKTPERHLSQGVRLVDGQWHGNEARFA